MDSPRVQLPGGPVVVVTGPTASGKSAVAIELCRRFDGEIVNADSMQVYRYMDIGTAKPSAEDRAQLPHHLFDVVTPEVIYSAGRFAREARRAASEIHGRGRLVVLTGGTGLYIRAFLRGIVDVGGANPEIRERLESEHSLALEQGDPDRLHRRLSELDPEAARAIHPHDLRRLERALEIIEVTGRPASHSRRDHAFEQAPYTSLQLALDPGAPELDRWIDQRCLRMIERGLLREVRQLRERGYGPELRSMQAIGYRHMGPVAEGSDTLANAAGAMQRDTRRFSRRQRTWLRSVPDAVWLAPDASDEIAKQVETLLEVSSRRSCS